MTLLPIAVPFSPKSERILDMSGSFFSARVDRGSIVILFSGGMK